MSDWSPEPHETFPDNDPSTREPEPKTLRAFARAMFDAGWRRGNQMDPGCTPEAFGDDDFDQAMREWHGDAQDNDVEPPRPAERMGLIGSDDTSHGPDGFPL